MKADLKPGLSYELQYTVPEERTVPFLFPDIEEGLAMPKVLASGFMVGLMEFACIKALKPYLDWPDEQTVGTGFKLDHTAATPAGFTVTVRVKLEKVEGRKLTFSIAAHDGVDQISKGTHERFVINAKTFNEAVAGKAEKHLQGQM
jgi:fluoroacetyl-CoA thioesterase